jgi:hypothetical protein
MFECDDFEMSTEALNALLDDRHQRLVENKRQMAISLDMKLQIEKLQIDVAQMINRVSSQGSN